jgi:SKI/SNO/DAC family/c-SKI Smad4 binding domain
LCSGELEQLKMQNISQQPCHPRIKRILNSYQQWAEHSLKGPSDSVEVRASVDVAPVCQSKSSVSDVVRGTLIKANLSRNDVVNSAAAAAPVKVEPCRIRTVSTSSFDSGDVERVAPKKVAKIVGQRMSDAVPNRPLLMAAEGAASYRLTETMLKDQPISCFNVGGERRLCMPQVLSKVLYSFSPARIQSASDELRINFAECNAGQLEALKRRSVLPAGVARCGLITQTDAERLCAILLGSQPAACSSRLDSTAIPVAHECFGGCRGVLLPREYKSPTSSCIECLKCNGRMNPAEFVSHTHSHREDQICHWGFDVSNWRFYLMVSQDDADASEVPKLQKTLDDLKLCFMGKEVSQVGVKHTI